MFLTGREDKAIHEINVVPLIDVSLVLVVILMLLTPLAFESNISVRRTQVSSKKAAPAELPERVEVTIVDETDVRVNRTVVPREQLDATLRPLLAGDAPPPVVVSCADAVSHGTFVGILDEAKQCGAQEIAITEGTN